jgi:hypothetical protein
MSCQYTSGTNYLFTIETLTNNLRNSVSSLYGTEQPNAILDALGTETRWEQRLVISRNSSSGESTMANFLLLYTGGGMPESKAEQEKVMQAWNAWFGKVGTALVDGGNPFTPMAKTIASDGKVTDGHVGTMATGYSVIKADSLAAAVELAKGCPVFLGGAKITVYETFPAM